MSIHISPTDHVQQVREIHPHLTWGTTILPSDALLLLHIGATGQQAIAPRKQQVFVGRIAEGTQHIPDIDLAPYKGVLHGVSRFHAAFTVTHNQVTITDLGSSNGTWLRGVKLEPHRASLIRAGDDIQFGTLLTYIYFLQTDAKESN